MPSRCVACHELTQSDFDLCNNCFKSIDFISSPFCDSCSIPFALDIARDMLCSNCEYNDIYFDKGRSLMIFNDHSRKLIHNFKFSDRIHSSKFFAKLLHNNYHDLIEESDIIAPVPMHRLKRLFRLYNPPQILAHAIHKISPEINFIPDLLIKSRYTRAQRKLRKSSRLKNLQNSIKLNNKYDISGKCILLIDDVITTGTTINYCSQILKKNKAAQVTFFTIARA